MTDIVRANVFTFFNGLLVTLFIVIAATGRWQNALFGGVVVANAAIGIVQELRAKRTLDRLAVLSAPRATVVRDGAPAQIAIGDVVADDLVNLRAGDQVPADGVIHTSDGLEIDESLLTGESDAIAKVSGDDVRSGSIVVAGRGSFQATAVGAQAYAVQIATEARRFKLAHSELVAATNRILRWTSVIIAIVGPIVLWSQFRSNDNTNWRDAVTGTVAALVGMIPEGLVLLTSLAFMLATVSLARQQTLVQQLPAVEGLARVDVVCLDKTGTLTHGDIAFDELIVLDESRSDSVARALGLIARTGEPNATASAVAEAFPKGEWEATGAVPFASQRKWSAVTAGARGTWIFGAPEMVLPHPEENAGDNADGDNAAAAKAREAARGLAASGRRVLVLAHSPHPPPGERSSVALPPDVAPVALVVLSERMRADAPDALRFFAEQGVTLKVISGDSPATVGAVAKRAGVPGAADAIDARGLPEDPEALADVVESHSVFGRVTPHQKRAMVGAMQRRGHVVAMTGDGVNDALALKDADIGVAMGSGAAATRAVAQIVLLDGKFAHLPDVVAEGRRVIATIERSANLFLIKNVYSLVLALITAATLSAYPMAPIQLTLISTLTIGIPGFVLALAPNRRRYLPGFLRRILRFAVPTGAVIGAIAYAGYWVARWADDTAGVDGGRTTATVVVLGVSLWAVVILARPLAGWKVGLIAVLTGLAVLAVAIPPIAQHVFLLQPTVPRILLGLGVAACGVALVEVTHRGLAAAVRRGERARTPAG